MKRAHIGDYLLGIVLIAHGLAHALAGTQLLARPDVPWVGWLAWCAAMTGFVAAGCAALDIAPFRHMVRQFGIPATAASIVLLLGYWPNNWSIPASSSMSRGRRGSSGRSPRTSTRSI